MHAYKLVFILFDWCLLHFIIDQYLGKIYSILHIYDIHVFIMLKFKRNAVLCC